MMTISVIVGSTRQNRFSEKPAQWIFQELRKREAVEARLLDLRDFPMPFFDQPLPPAMPGRPPYEHDVGKKWTSLIAGSDGVQQLRETAVEIQMAPIRSSVHIPVATLWAHFQGGDVKKGLTELGKQANVMLDDLLWWTQALKDGA